MTRDEYLAQVSIGLSRLPKEVADGRIRELRSHLDMAVRELGEDAQSETEAMARMGSPEVVAEEIVRQHFGIATGSSWSIARGVGLVVAFAILAPYACRYAMSGSPRLLSHWPVSLEIQLVWSVVVVSIGWQAWRTRRWLFGPVAVWAAGATLAAFVLTVLPAPRPTASGIAADLGAVRLELKSVEPMSSAATMWRLGRPREDVAPEPDGVGFRLVATSAGDSRRAWNRWGAQFDRWAQYRWDDLAGQESAYRTMLDRPLPFGDRMVQFAELFPLVVAFYLAVFAALNTIVLGTASLSHRYLRFAR